MGLPKEKPDGLDKPVVARIIKYGAKANVAVFRLTNGRIAVRARVVDAAERAVLWPRLLDLYGDFATYEQWTDRVIPVIVLEPR